jgi:hypothetical protein
MIKLESRNSGHGWFKITALQIIIGTGSAIVYLPCADAYSLLHMFMLKYYKFLSCKPNALINV